MGANQACCAKPQTDGEVGAAGAETSQITSDAPLLPTPEQEGEVAAAKAEASQITGDAPQEGCAEKAPSKEAEKSALIEKLLATAAFDGSWAELCTDDALLVAPGGMEIPVAMMMQGIANLKVGFTDYVWKSRSFEELPDGRIKAGTQQVPGKLKADLPAIAFYPAVCAADAPESVLTKEGGVFPVEVGYFTFTDDCSKISKIDYSTGELGDTSECDSTVMEKWRAGIMGPPLLYDLLKKPPPSSPPKEKAEEVKETLKEATKAPEKEVEPDMSKLKYELELTIKSARGLRNADWAPGTGLSDPFCVCEVSGKEVAKTETINDQLDPVWNMTCTIPDVVATDALVFRVLDSDGIKSDALGHISLPASKVAPFGFDGELRLEDAAVTAKAVNAYITVSVKILSSRADAVVSKVNSTGKTKVAAKGKSKAKAKAKSKGDAKKKEAQTTEKAEEAKPDAKEAKQDAGGSGIDLAARKAAWNALSKKEKDTLMKQFHKAAADGDMSGVEQALDANCDVNVQGEDPNSSGEAALHFAANKGHKGIVSLLVGTYNANKVVKAKYGEWGFTPLHYAARNGSLEITQLVFDPKANHADNYLKKTPAELAKKEGHDEVVKLLKKLKKGA